MREGVPGGAGQGGGASHGVMSPSLTSGFSGSGDCKSTETCSLLSVASYSSATPAEKVPPAPVSRHVVSCEVIPKTCFQNLKNFVPSLNFPPPGLPAPLPQPCCA